MLIQRNKKMYLKIKKEQVLKYMFCIFCIAKIKYILLSIGQRECNRNICTHHCILLFLYMSWRCPKNLVQVPSSQDINKNEFRLKYP